MSNLLTTVAPLAGMTFSRSSTATKLDGSTAASGVPRIEAGRDGNAIMIEEGTTNLAYNPSAELGNLNGLIGLYATTTIDTEHCLFGAHSLKAVATGTVFGIYLKDSAGSRIAVTAGAVYTSSVYCYAAFNRSITPTIEWYDSTGARISTTAAGTQAITANAFTRIICTGTAPVGAVSCAPTFYFTGVVGESVWYDGAQLEQKPYATTFTENSRAAESLSISPASSVLSTASGTIEGWFNVKTVYQIASKYQPIITMETSEANRLLIMINQVTGKLTVWPGVVGFSSPTIVPAGVWNHFAVTWDALGVKLYENGKLTASTATVLSVNFSSALFFGANFGNLNGQIADVRISNISRTAEGIYTGYRSCQPIDVNTTAFITCAKTGLYLVKPDNRFVHIGANPARESSEKYALQQAVAHDSSLQPYVYDKGQFVTITHQLTFNNVSGFTLATMKDFLAGAVRGSKTPFTWIDHQGVAHTVRALGDLNSTPGGNLNHRIEIELEEQTGLNAPVAGTIAQNRARTSGVAPVWILKLKINNIDYYLSGSTFTVNVGGWSSIVTKPWVSRWGQIRSGSANTLDEFRVADLDIDLLIDSAANPNMETLVTTYPVEKSAASLFLWYLGATEAPVEMFRGYVRDVEIPDETMVSITIEDESIRLQNSLGTQIDLATYPGADPDDVGKVIPIVYGSVRKLPALCVKSGWVSALTGDITAAAVTVVVSEVPAYSLVGKTITIDEEKLYVSAQYGTSLTVVRGNSATIPVSHTKGTVALEVMTSAIVYLLADHALDSIGNIYTRISNVDVDITADCTKYLGTTGNQHGTYPGKAVVTVANLPAIKNKISLALLDTGHNHNSATSTTENTTLSLPAATVYYGNYPQPSGYSYAPGFSQYKNVTFPASGGTRSSCAYSITINPTVTRSARILVVIAGVCKWWSDVNLVSGSPLTITFTAAAGAEANANNFDIVHPSGQGNYFNITASSRMVYLASVPSTYSASGSSLAGNSVADTLIGGTVVADVARALDVSGVYTDILNRSGSAATVSITGDQSLWALAAGTAGQTGTPYQAASLGTELVTNGTFAVGTGWTLNGPTISGGVLICGTAYAPGIVAAQTLADLVIGKLYRFSWQMPARTSGNLSLYVEFNYCDYNISATGTYTADFVAVYASARILIVNESPGWIGSVDNISLREVIAEVPAGPDTPAVPAINVGFNGVINSYKPARYWLNLLAFQCRSIFRMEIGSAKLRIRPNSLTSSRSISACRLSTDGRKKHSRKKTDTSGILNKIAVLYNRDWSQAAGPDAYRGNVMASDATSISNYGICERPDLFQFDFVTDDLVAANLLAFYLAEYKDRGWLHEFEGFLNISDLTVGSVITLGFAPNAPVGTVVEVGLSPGSAREIDVVKVTVEG